MWEADPLTSFPLQCFSLLISLSCDKLSFWRIRNRETGGTFLSCRTLQANKFHLKCALVDSIPLSQRDNKEQKEKAGRRLLKSRDKREARNSNAAPRRLTTWFPFFFIGFRSWKAHVGGPLWSPSDGSFAVLNFTEALRGASSYFPHLVQHLG